MNCQEYREMIEDALDISIHGELEAHVRRHLEHCAECRDYFAARQAEHVALFTAVNAAYAHLRPPPSDFVDRLAREVKARRATRRGWRRFSPPRWTLIAASLVLVVGFVFAASYMVERLASASYAADSRRDLPIQCDDSRTTAMAEINETVNLPVSDVAVDCSVDERYSGRTFTPTTEGTKNMNMKNAAGVVVVAATASSVTTLS